MKNWFEWEAEFEKYEDDYFSNLNNHLSITKSQLYAKQNNKMRTVWQAPKKQLTTNRQKKSITKILIKRSKDLCIS